MVNIKVVDIKWESNEDFFNSGQTEEEIKQYLNELPTEIDVTDYGEEIAMDNYSEQGVISIAEDIYIAENMFCGVKIADAKVIGLKEFIEDYWEKEREIWSKYEEEYENSKR